MPENEHTPSTLAKMTDIVDEDENSGGEIARSLVAVKSGTLLQKKSFFPHSFAFI